MHSTMPRAAFYKFRSQQAAFPIVRYFQFKDPVQPESLNWKVPLGYPSTYVPPND